MAGSSGWCRCLACRCLQHAGQARALLGVRERARLACSPPLHSDSTAFAGSVQVGLATAGRQPSLPNGCTRCATVCVHLVSHANPGQAPVDVTCAQLLTAAIQCQALVADELGTCLVRQCTPKWRPALASGGHQNACIACRYRCCRLSLARLLRATTVARTRTASAAAAASLAPRSNDRQAAPACSAERSTRSSTPRC